MLENRGEVSRPLHQLSSLIYFPLRFSSSSPFPITIQPPSASSFPRPSFETKVSTNKNRSIRYQDSGSLK